MSHPPLPAAADAADAAAAAAAVAAVCVGLPSYCEFLCLGSELLGSLHRWGEAVALLEGVQSEWRQKRHLGEPAEKKALKEKLRLLALKLSLEGGLHRLALSFLRRLLQRRLRRGPPPWGLLGVYGRLLFRKAEGALGSISSSKDKEFLLENRSWVIRQLLCHPQDYALCLLAGHFSMTSSRWKFAAAEYTRALYHLPRDELAALCLAASLLAHASSHGIQDRHGAVLKSFSALCHYIELRHQAQLGCTDRQLFVAETIYNLARAYHHLRLFHLCVPLYLRCLSLLGKSASPGSPTGLPITPEGPLRSPGGRQPKSLPGVGLSEGVSGGPLEVPPGSFHGGPTQGLLDAVEAPHQLPSSQDPTLRDAWSQLRMVRNQEEVEEEVWGLFSFLIR
ncbi:hypothetical protein ACSSS7_007283 [Eimeria intestinalis]